MSEWLKKPTCIKGIDVTNFLVWMFFLYMLWASFWPQSLTPFAVLEIHHPPCVREPVYAGEYMVYEMHVSKLKSVSGFVTKKLVDGETINLESGVSDIPVEKDRVSYPKVFIPAHTTPKEYRFLWTVEYKMELPFVTRVIKYSEMSKPFNVLPPREKR